MFTMAYRLLPMTSPTIAPGCASVWECLCGCKRWMPKPFRGKVLKMPHAKHVTRVLRLQPLLGKRKQLLKEKQLLSALQSQAHTIAAPLGLPPCVWRAFCQTRA